MNSNNNELHTKDQMIEFYKNISDDAKNILIDDNFGPAIQVIGKENGLTALQSLDVEDIVVYTLLGINKREDVAMNITGKLNISLNTAQKIANDLDENIFSQIKKPSMETNKTKGININTQEDKSKKKKLAIEELSKPISTPTPPKQQVLQPNAIQKEAIQPKTKPATPPIKPETKTPTTQTPNKTIIGANKIGVGIPAKEHQFEEKLRNAFESQKIQNLNTTSNTTEEKQKITQDPYREPLE